MRHHAWVTYVFVTMSALGASMLQCAPSDHDVEAAGLQPATPASAPAIPIAGLELRDRRVTIASSGRGLLVTVKGPDGALLADAIPLEKLKTTDPFLYDVCGSTVASNGAYLDARFDPPARMTLDSL
jgi:hypothetical protein